MTEGSLPISQAAYFVRLRMKAATSFASRRVIARFIRGCGSRMEYAKRPGAKAALPRDRHEWRRDGDLIALLRRDRMA